MADDETAIFNTIQQTPNLRSGLVDTLIAQIESGDLAPGQRLPTEQAIMAATSVSRTVVREALASLRAKGLITTRQGLGAFVADDPHPRTFSIIPTDLESIDEVLHILELRMGIEVEAAGLAALRRTNDDLERMAARMSALEVSILGGGSGIEEDFAFHRAILVATHNSYYARLFDTFGSTLAPRMWTRLDVMENRERKKYIARMKREHGLIFNAIRNGEPAAAQKAMRIHLTKSSSRFIDLRDQATQR